MIFYLTYNDLPSGIFSSQVIDVVNFLKEQSQEIRLISFISLRNFFRNRKAIKKEIPQAIVLPMFPKLKNWRKNTWLLTFYCRLYRPKLMIARSVMAANMALIVKNRDFAFKVVYDGRGAIGPEWREYKVVQDDELLKEIDHLEKCAVIKSDYRISVSEKLVEFWQQSTGYNGKELVIIPCTINQLFEKTGIDALIIARRKKQLGFAETDIVYVYSGSIAGWQSFSILDKFIEPVLTSSKANKLLFLSPLCEEIKQLKLKFGEQIFQQHLSPSEVPEYLLAADYGLLIRENSITNYVASPVKFAEYLSCGLKVIISSELGDYSALTMKHNLGYVIDSLSGNSNLGKVEIGEKLRVSQFAKLNFTKRAFKAEYKKLLEL